MQALFSQVLLTCLEESEYGIILLNSAKQIIFWNHWLLNTTSISSEQVLGQTIEDVFPEIAKSQITIAIEKALELGNASVLLPHLNSSQFSLFQTKNGYKEKERLQQQIFIKPIFPPNLPRYCLIQICDVTSLINREYQLSEPVDKLDRLGNSALSTHISHELHTPLNVILGYTQLFQKDKTLNTEQQEWINLIYTNCKELLNLIAEILNISSLKVNQLELSPHPFHLPMFLQDITELFQKSAEQKNISFTYKPLLPFPSLVYADEKRLRQIVNNLLNNIIKLTKRGEVFLTVGYQKGKIYFYIQNIGLERVPKQIKNLLVPFQKVNEEKANYQVEKIESDLTIIQKIVELMGGQLHVKSTLSNKLQLWLSLKLPKASENVGKKPTQKSSIIGFQEQTQKILVADDKKENRFLLTIALKRLGFEIMEAGNGQEAIDKLHEWRPDLVLMDLVMPVVDGIEAIHRIRQIPEFKDIIVIAISANTFKYNLENTAVGYNALITKPIHFDTLLECIRTHLNLTWIYEQKSANIASNNSTEQQTTDVFVVGPSPKQATILFNLARKGDIKGIIEFLKQLEETDKQLIPFTRKIHLLAKNLQKKEICRLTEPYCKK